MRKQTRWRVRSAAPPSSKHAQNPKQSKLGRSAPLHDSKAHALDNGLDGLGACGCCCCWLRHGCNKVWIKLRLRQLNLRRRSHVGRLPVSRPIFRPAGGLPAFPAGRTCREVQIFPDQHARVRVSTAAATARAARLKAATSRGTARSAHRRHRRSRRPRRFRFELQHCRGAAARGSVRTAKHCHCPWHRLVPPRARVCVRVCRLVRFYGCCFCRGLDV